MADGFSERTGYIQSDMTPPFELSESVEVGVTVEHFSYVDGIIYLGYRSQDGPTFRAFDPDTDEVIWERLVPGSSGAVGFVPAVSDDLVYLGGQRGMAFYAVDRMTGDSVWAYPTQSMYGRNVAIKDDKLYIQHANEGLICFNKSTGEVFWSYGQWSSQTVPLVDDKHVYYHSRSDDTLRTFTHDGEEVWEYPMPSELLDFEATMAVGDTIFIKSRTHLIALDQDTGNEFWKVTLVDTNSYITTSNALTYTPEMLIVHEWRGDWQGEFMIQGYRYEDGQMMWSHDLEDGSGGPAVAFGNYLVHVNGGDLEIRNAADGNIIQEIEGLDLTAYTRVKVVDGLILAAGGTQIHMFTPITTGLTTSDKLDIEWGFITNPVKERLNIELTVLESLDLQYRIYDMKGVSQDLIGEWHLRKGNNLRDVDISGLSAGQYILTANSGHRTSSLRFIKS